MYKRTTEITEYKVLEAQDVDLGASGGTSLGRWWSMWSTRSPTMPR
jgi:hypothetical protein